VFVNSGAGVKAGAAGQKVVWNRPFVWQSSRLNSCMLCVHVIGFAFCNLFVQRLLSIGMRPSEKYSLIAAFSLSGLPA
jgi:hypothetical protein